MTFWDNVTTYLGERGNLRKVVLGAVAVLILGGVVLFSSQIQNLLNLFPSGAAPIGQSDLDERWHKVVCTGGEARAHAKMIDVTYNGETWLYVLGGSTVEYVPSLGRNQTIVHDSVQRLRLRAEDGLIDGATWDSASDPTADLVCGPTNQWEEMPDMNFGHMEFGIVQAGDYLYVVAGDMHIPVVADDEVPLLYSTVERLNLANPAAGWQVFANLSGVNYYPEVIADGTDIHVVGGVYGNPFPPPTGVAQDVNTGDIIISGGGGSTTVGGVGTDLPSGPIGSTIVVGGVVVPGTTGGDDGVIVVTPPSGDTNQGSTGGSDNPPPSVPGGSGPGGVLGEQSATVDAPVSTSQKIIRWVASLSRSLASAWNNVWNRKSVARADEGVAIQAVGGSPGIIVTDPNGGDNTTLQAGTQHTIRWNATPDADVSLWLEAIAKPGGGEWTRIRRSVSSGTESYSWTVPNISTGAAKIWVCVESGQYDGRCDDSDWPFEIVSSPPSTAPVTVTQPNGGETIIATLPYTITWTPAGNTRLFYEMADDTWQFLGQQSGGSYNWTPPPTLLGDGVVFACNTDYTYCDASDATFTVVPPPDPNLQMITPNGGEVLDVGSSYSVTWDVNPNAHSTIWWRHDGGSWDRLPSSASVFPPGSESFTWTVPNVPTTTAQMRVCLLNEPAVCDISDGTFTIQSAPPPASQLHLVQPNGTPLAETPRQTLQAGDSYSIAWDGSPVNAWISVWWKEYVGSWQHIANGRSDGSTGTHTWLVPEWTSALPVELAQARVCVESSSSGTSCSGDWDASDGYFDILPYYWAKWVRPQGGDEYLGGSRYTISWTGHGLSSQGVSIDWRVAGTSAWTSVTSSAPSGATSGSYAWDVPDVDSDTQAQLRVCAKSSANPPTPYDLCRYGTSETFTIKTQGPDYIQVISPNGGENWQPGSQQQITWSTNVPYGERVTIFYSTEEVIPGSPLWIKIVEDVPIYPRQYTWTIPQDLYADTALVLVQTQVSESHWPTVWDASDNYFSINGGEDVAEILSEALISGEFVTTVSEHYILRPSGNHSAGELGNDYIGTLEDKWRVNKVAHIGHLRFMLVPDLDTGSLRAIPVPQGRYGHHLIKRGGNIYAIGGASWAKELRLTTLPFQEVGQVAKSEHFKTFWVIDDDVHPVYTTGDEFEFKYGKANYQFVGHIAYTLASGTTWSVADNYSFKIVGGAAKGRAFFGLAPAGGSLVATSGLRNAETHVQSPSERYDYLFTPIYNPTRHEISHFRIPVAPTASTDLMTSGTWLIVDNYPAAPAYNLSMFGLNNAAVAYSGQNGFEEAWPNSGYYWYPNDLTSGALARDPHVPDYDFTFNDVTAMYIPVAEPLYQEGWNPMPNTRLSPPGRFAANRSVTTVFGSAATRADTIYQYGGIDSSNFQILGPFGGPAGVLDMDQSWIEVEPLVVKADGIEKATATLHMVDYFGNPVVVEEGLAVSPYTSRSAFPAVMDDTKADWIEISGITQSPPIWGAGYADSFVYIDRGNDEDGNPDTGLGEARFTIASGAYTGPDGIGVLAYLANIDLGYSAVSGLSGGPLVFTRDGIPTDLNSLIEADPIQVAADGVDTSTITVTLRDYRDAPVSGYWVSISSTRNEDGAIIDNITPDSAVTDENGQAGFTVSSAVRGSARFWPRYGVDEDMLTNNPVSWAAKFATVEFASFIVSLEPAAEYQGAYIPYIEARGQATGWVNGETTVELVAPGNLSFYWIDSTGEQHTMDTFHLVAGDRSAKHLGLSVPALPNTNVSLALSGAGGQFWPQYSDTTVVTTDANGQADFWYLAGTNIGIAKLSASAAGGSTTGRVWFVLEDPNPGVSYYDVRLSADPSSVEAGGTSAIRVVVYRRVGSDWELVTEPLDITLSKDQSAGTLSPIEGTAGIYRSTYARGSESGPVHIFAELELDGYYLTDRVLVNNLGDSVITGSGTNVINSTTLRFEDVNISENATVGLWTFMAHTSEQGDIPAETVTYPFRVLEVGSGAGAHLASIDPWIVTRPESGSSDYSVDIVGEDTHFTASSQVIFEPVGTSDNSGIEVISVTRNSPTSLTADISVAHDAFAGYWNVRVQSGVEIAALAGDTDFLVTADNNYIVDVTANPNRLPRDGQATSRVQAFVGQLDPVSGQITPLPDIDVVYSIGTDPGSLTPDPDDDNYSLSTNSQGVAESVYTVDAAEEDGLVTVVVTADIDGVLVANSTIIIKYVSEHQFGLIASPTVLPLAGDPKNSLLTADVFDLDGNPVPNGTNVSFFVDGTGYILPSVSGTIAGEATTTYYRADGLNVPETVRVFARADIPGVGRVYSNDAFIEIGLSSSNYQLTFLTDNGTNYKEVTAGGSTYAELTATLRYQGSPVRNWPLSFTMGQPGYGDYLTIIAGRTNSSGQLVTRFIPGTSTGPVTVTARPVGLGVKTVIINKTASSVVDLGLSTLTAVPVYVPANGDSVSVITATIKNSNGVPLVGKVVTLEATIGVIVGTNPQTTNGAGQAVWQLRSNIVGNSQVTATVDNRELTTTVVFVDEGDLIPHTLDVTVPFEARDYDNEVKLVLTEDDSGDVFISAVFAKNPRPNDRLDGLAAITIYLRPNRDYTLWAKGRNHLARTQDFRTGSIGGTIELDFGLGSDRRGLYIGDLLPNEDGDGNPTPFHDNFVNTTDLPPLYTAWFQNSYLADFLRDFVVNTVDFSYWAKNYGPGDQLP